MVTGGFPPSPFVVWISFGVAQYVFLDKKHLILYDDKNSIDEERYIAIGMIL